MNFELSDEQKLVRQTARDFARQEIQPIAAQCDRESRFPIEVFNKAREIGLVNMTVPNEFGGGGWSALELGLVTSELGWACTGIAGAFGLNTIFGDVFHVAGSREQKREAFGRLQAGEFGAYAVTEPVAGSDVASIKTRAVKRGDRYVLNGSKVWISNAPVAQMFVIFAKTDPEAGHRGISAFFVNRDTPGLSVGAPLGKLGQRAGPAAEARQEKRTFPFERARACARSMKSRRLVAARNSRVTGYTPANLVSILAPSSRASTPAPETSAGTETKAPARMK